MPLEKTDNLTETRDPEPDTCPAISSASEPEAEKSEGASTTTAPEEQDCVPEEMADSPQAETGGKNQYPFLQLWPVRPFYVSFVLVYSIYASRLILNTFKWRGGLLCG